MACFPDSVQLRRALHAAASPDLKRLLAYSTVDNMGLVLIGVGVSGALAVTRHDALAVLAMVAALFQMMNHAAFKGCLFLAATSAALLAGVAGTALGGPPPDPVRAGTGLGLARSTDVIEPALLALLLAAGLALAWALARIRTRAQARPAPLLEPRQQAHELISVAGWLRTVAPRPTEDAAQMAQRRSRPSKCLGTRKALPTTG